MKCDFQLGESPGSLPCPDIPVVECSCRRCKEGDPFQACAAHRDAVRYSHSRVFPNHEVHWVEVAFREPPPTAPARGTWHACGGGQGADCGSEAEPGATTSFIRHTPFDLRCLGWSVAVHNDYRLNGESHTFWLLSKGDRFVKGEGRTDLEALDSIREQLRSR